MSERTPGVNVERASDLIRRTVSLPASMLTPESWESVISEVQLADERLHQRAPRRSGSGIPERPPREHEEPLLVEILFEHVEAFREQADGLVTIRSLCQTLEHQRGVAQRDGA